MDFRVKNYLPFSLVVLGIGFVIMGVFGIIENPGLSSALIFAGLVLTTTQHRLEVNLSEKYFHEYVWFLAIKHGSKIKFDELQYIYITVSKRSQVYGQTYKNHYLTVDRFHAYLKISEQRKILMGASNSRNSLLRRIKKINAKLFLEVKDYTETTTRYPSEL